MSHFNLNNGMPRKRYIGPTHKLNSQPGTSSLENLGGRITIESEMYSHKQKMREIKPSIDSSLPWAHRHQEGLKRKYKYNSSSHDIGGGMRSGSVNSRRIPPVGEYYLRSSSPSSVWRMSRSATPLGAGSPPNISTGYRSRKGIPASPSVHSRPYSNAMPSSGLRDDGQEGPSPPSYYDCTTLSREHRDIYKSLVIMLSEMPQIDGKCFLEQVYREAEERKLLKAYSGSFPTDGNHGAHQQEEDTCGRSRSPVTIKDDDSESERESEDHHRDSPVRVPISPYEAPITHDSASIHLHDKEEIIADGLPTMKATQGSSRSYVDSYGSGDFEDDC